MDLLRREILVTFQNLMRNLGLDYEIDDVEYLAHEDLYLEIFATMFPMLRDSIVEIASEPEEEKGERIQSLIEFLSTEILNLDLSHIRGSLIADGDLKHILNFLQLLLEISKMFLQKKQSDEQDYSDQDERRGKGRKSHSAHSEGEEPEEQDVEEYEGYGDEEEEGESLGELEHGADPNLEEVMDILNKPKKGHDYSGDRERASGGRQAPPGSQSDGVSRISEVSKSKESSEYESYNKKFSSRQKASLEERGSQKKKARSFEKQPEDYERYDYGYGEQGAEGEYNREQYEDGHPRGETDQHPTEEEGQIDPEDLRYDVKDKDYMRLVQRGPGAKKTVEQYQREQYEEQPPGGQKGIGAVNKKKQTGKSKSSAQKVKLRPLHQTPYGNEQTYPSKQKKPVKQQTKKLRPKTAGARQQRRVGGEEETALHHSESKKHLETIDEMARGKQGLEDQEEQEDEEGVPQEDVPEEDDEQAQGSQYDENAGDQHNIQASHEDAQLGDENMLYSILSKNIKHVRYNLENLRSTYLTDDEPKTQELILQQKNAYKSYLNRYLNHHRIKENKGEQSKNVNEKNFAHSVKAQILNDQKVDEVLDNQQKSLFLKLRDEKINYLRKIHKIVFELEKKKLIEEKKEQMEVRKSKNEQTRLVVESIQNMYKSKLDLLREKQINDEQERKLVQGAQKKMLRDLQKEIKSNKMKEIEILKNKWNSEKEKFDSLMHDNGYLEEKIMKVYKRFN